jgi:DNA-binding ferritin-like protein
MSSHSDRLAARAHTAPEPPQSSAAGDVQLADLLDGAAAEVTDVALCVRHAYWHRRGVDFLELYELLDDVGNRLDRVAVDLAAQSRVLRFGERAARWGHQSASATESSFKPYPIEIFGGQDHLAAVTQRMALVRANLGATVHAASHLGALCAADGLCSAHREIEAVAALIEQHLATRAPGPVGQDQADGMHRAAQSRGRAARSTKLVFPPVPMRAGPTQARTGPPSTHTT